MEAKRKPLDPATAELLAERFRALADPTRLLILDGLRRNGEVAVRDIAAAVGASQQNTSKHLAVLRAERVVGRRKQGTSTLYRITDGSVSGLCDLALDENFNEDRRPRAGREGGGHGSHEVE